MDTDFQTSNLLQAKDFDIPSDNELYKLDLLNVEKQFNMGLYQCGKVVCTQFPKFDFVSESLLVSNFFSIFYIFRESWDSIPVAVSYKI